MTVHYHGTPITPNAVLLSLSGRNFCVSHARPDQVKLCFEIGQLVMLDNGAFSHWRKGIDKSNWLDYYLFCDEYLDCPTVWAVIPDTIRGTEKENDDLLDEWPFPDRGAPVWHLHESFERLDRLIDNYPKVCFGSSGEYASPGSKQWNSRVSAAFDLISTRLRTPWIHMLRGMKFSGQHYPFSSVDSTDVARNHKRPGKTALLMAHRWDSLQCPATWNNHLTGGPDDRQANELHRSQNTQGQ